MTSYGGRPLSLVTWVFAPWAQLHRLPVATADLDASVAEYLTGAEPFIGHHPLCSLTSLGIGVCFGVFNGSW